MVATEGNVTVIFGMPDRGGPTLDRTESDVVAGGFSILSVPGRTQFRPDVGTMALPGISDLTVATSVLQRRYSRLHWLPLVGRIQVLEPMPQHAIPETAHG